MTSHHLHVEVAEQPGEELDRLRPVDHREAALGGAVDGREEGMGADRALEVAGGPDFPR